MAAVEDSKATFRFAWITEDEDEPGELIEDVDFIDAPNEFLAGMLARAWAVNGDAWDDITAGGLKISKVEDGEEKTTTPVTIKDNLLPYVVPTEHHPGGTAAAEAADEKGWRLVIWERKKRFEYHSPTAMLLAGYRFAHAVLMGKKQACDVHVIRDREDSQGPEEVVCGVESIKEHGAVRSGAALYPGDWKVDITEY